MGSSLPTKTKETPLGFWFRALASLFRNFKSRSFIRDLLTVGLRADAELRAPAVWIGSVFPEIYGLPVNLGIVTYEVGNVTPFELYCLVAIAQLQQPRTIFEFGTYDGSTALALARAVPDARVFTVDLPTADSPGDMAAPVEVEVARRRGQGVGSAFAGLAEASRIDQIWGDSRSLDYREFARRVDLVFIDASHEHRFVAADTESALGMVAPGGMVIWHDYTGGWPGVQMVVDELVRQGEPVVRLDGTSLALLPR